MNALDAAYHAFQNFLQKDRWAVWLTIGLVVFSFFTATPSFRFLMNAPQDTGWQTVMQQKEAGTIIQPDAPEMSQAAKKTFRLTVPLVAKVLHLNPYGIYALQCLIGALFIFLVLRFVEQQTNDRLLAALFGICFATVFVGRACFTDVYSRFEGWCYFFLFLSVFFQRGWLVFVFAFLACWTDERAVIGLGNAALWWYAKDFGFGKPTSIKPLVTSRAALVVYAASLYLSLRLFLQFQFGFHTPASGVGFVYILRGFRYFNFGTWTFLEGLWFLVLWKFYLLARHRRYFFFALSSLVNAMAIVSSYLVFDITRSGSFMFLETFVALAVILHFAPSRLPNVLKYSTLVCVLFPPYYIILDTNPYVLQFESVPIQAVKWFANKYFP